MAIFVDQSSWIMRCDDVDEDVLLLQKCFQIPDSINHLTAFLEPADRPAVFGLLQTSWNLEMLVKVGKVITQPYFVGDGDPIAVP